jgi:serine protease Do
MLPTVCRDWPVRFTLPRVRGAALGLCLTLLLPNLAAAQFMGLKPKLYTTGTTLRRSFSEVTAAARASTVQVLDERERIAYGVVVTADGFILTKASELGPQPEVRLPNGDTVDAQLIGIHDGTDLALLKVAASDLTPIEWETATPAVGQWVISTGDRETPEAIGVVGTSRRKIERERESGVLGVKLEGDDGPPTVVAVYENSGAKAAGMLAGDTILRINGDDVSSRSQMINKIRRLNPGDAVKLVIRREAEELNMEATLTPPPHEEFMSRISIQNQMGGDLSRRRNGFDAVIQHDSVLRPEKCGGPAVGLNGKAIGINIARAGRTETYTLPADLILPVIDELKLRAPASVVSME